MGRYFMLFICMNILHGIIYGQQEYELKGVVYDNDRRPLPGATVILKPVNTGTTTDQNGVFILHNLEKGIYVIEISFIGFENRVDSLTINGSRTYSAQLKTSSLNLQEIVVTDNYAESRKQEVPLNIEIVNNDYLRQNLGASLMNSLERLPGVSTIDIGAGQSKPVIRGLGFNRVVVVDNNIKHEAQQWGADHGLEIDQYAVDNIEVIKGPASLMVGSDAIGGVIDMKSRKIPEVHTLGGTVDLSGKSNNDFLGGSVSLYGRKHLFFFDIRATVLDYGDYTVPADSIDIYSYRAPLYRHHMRNTAGEEQNLHATIGILKGNFQSKFVISNVKSRNGFFANAHGLEPRRVDTDLHDKSDRDINDPFHTVDHFKVLQISQYTRNKIYLESSLGYQHNFREEWSQYVSHGYMPAVFPDSLNYDADLELLFDKQVYSGNLHLDYHKSDKTTISLGVNSEYQDNCIGGRAFIIPAFTQFTIGAVAVAKHRFSEKSLLQAGIRYDRGHLNTRAYTDWYESPSSGNADTSGAFLLRAAALSRHFSNISWSVGYNYNPKNWSVKTNIGKSFRMPIAKELAANGVNYHHFSYEVGNSGLSPEISYQLDAGVEYNSSKIAIGATPFVNYFTNYIYLNPTSEHDRLYGNGNQVFYYTQSEVWRYGAELHAHYQLLKSVQLGIIGEHVHAKQLSGEKKGYSLPFSPPATLLLNVKYSRQKLNRAENVYASLDLKITNKQTEIVPPEEITKGSRIINLAFGGDLRFSRQTIKVAVQVQNLLNTRYYSHTSYYRLINVPEPGRNFIVNLSYPFTIR